MTVYELEQKLSELKRDAAAGGLTISSYEVVVNSAPGEYRDAGIEVVEVSHRDEVLRLEGWA